MRTFDFAPLYRSTVGFDRMFSVLDQLDGLEGSVPSYPPYNIERNGENAFRISVAVAGFTNADLSIETKENTLTIHGEKQATDEEKRSEVLYKGIAERAFERSFQLDTLAEPKPRSRKLTYAYLLRSLRTLRFLFIARAGRLTRLGGRNVLRLTENPATEALYGQIAHRLVA